MCGTREGRDRDMGDSSKIAADTERLSDSLNRELEPLLASARTTAELWQTLQRLGPFAPGEPPLRAMLRNGLRTELARREQRDAAAIHALVEEALLTGDLRPFWAARATYASTSPDLTTRLFPHES